MFTQLVSSKFLKESIKVNRLSLVVNHAFRNDSHAQSYSTSTSQKYDKSIPPRQQQSSLFRTLAGLTVLIGGTSAAIYFTQAARDYVTEQVPQTKTYFQRLDALISDFLSAASSLEMPSFLKARHIQVPSREPTSEENAVAPAFPSELDASKQVGDSLRDTVIDLPTAIRNAEVSVQTALADLQHFEMTIRRHIDEQQLNTRKCESPQLVMRKLEAARQKASKSYLYAERSLTELRSVLDAAKNSVIEDVEETMVRRAIKRYSDLAYELSGLVNEVRRLENHLVTLGNFTSSELAERSRLKEDLKSILPRPSKDKIFLDENGEQLTAAELNALLSMALERIDTLCVNLDSSGFDSKQRMLNALKSHHIAVTRDLVKEAVDREVSRERAQHELDRLEWGREAKAKTEHELNLALARHGHHLAQMLRLKQEELEHQFEYRLREALVEQKVVLEGELAKWMKTMQAIEQVVDGRADIDRIAKETQGLWLAVEALAFALEMPFSKIGATGKPIRSEMRPFYTSQPLEHLVGAIRQAALQSKQHEFALEVIEALPEEVLKDGVWTRQGLLHRFGKVYKLCRNVALVDEASTSLWGYFISWLQSRLLFDSFGRRRWAASRLPGIGEATGMPVLLTPETEVSESVTSSLDALCLLASARAALMPDSMDTLVSVDSVNCSDIEFAVRLLGQLKGQPAAVAADWLHDARHFLEVHQAVQALLAYATALNVSVFEERL